MPTPAFRKLRVFAFDPSVSTQFDTAGVNVVTLKVPWEENLLPGPSGEYLNVLDFDDAGQRLPGVDLNDPYLLHESGLPPSQANRKFHQQMVYAVIMSTIKHFEDALGRPLQWSARHKQRGKKFAEDFVRQLSVYTNVSEVANAWYDPFTKGLYFGYVFPAEATGMLPDAIVRTCLSHDIVAHEATHAIIDGMHRRFLEPSNPDVLAFHEAFSDIVALFQHFTYTDVLTHQIGRARGNIQSSHLLLGLAKQLGDLLRPQFGALRSALGEYDEKTGQRYRPDRVAWKKITEPHARGGVLVGAVFDAFLTIYRSRTIDLVRLATDGRGILPDGDLHPDLVNRLAAEASKASAHVLQMCIRALDYLPPVDVTFGEFLRAVITADQDIVVDDDRHYRLAFVDAFQRRGIYPSSVECLAEDSLRWLSPAIILGRESEEVFNKRAQKQIIDELRRWKRNSPREDLYKWGRNLRIKLHQCFAALRDDSKNRLRDQNGTNEASEFEFLTGLALSRSAPRSIRRDKFDNPKFEVHAASPARRVGPDGNLESELIVSVTQRRQGFFDSKRQAQADDGKLPPHVRGDFWFRGGCTLVINLDTAQPRLIIRKDILAPGRLERQRLHLQRK